MQASNKLLCVSLILSGLVTQCFGLGIMAMDKRGWTLNSAGYLLGPNASNGYRNLNAKGGLAGKRDNLYQHDNPDFKTLHNPINERALQRLLQALAYSRKEGERIVLDNAAVPFFSEDTRKA